MSHITDHLDRIRVAALPHSRTASGAARTVAVGLSFGGLGPRSSARLAQAELGGQVTTLPDGGLVLGRSALGDLHIRLDTGFRDRAIDRVAPNAPDLSGLQPPVRIDTPPLPPERLALLDRLRATLRDHGATGSRDGTLLGFGLTFDTAIAGESVHDILPVVRAYALLEDWLRQADRLPGTRRIVPHPAAYPAAFVDDLAHDAPKWSRDAFWCVYLHYNPTRNRGLDLMPLIAAFDPGRIECLGARTGPVVPRAAFHYRLPDARPEREDWSIAYEWNRWVAVERLAAAPQLCARLAADWREHRAAGRPAADWRDHVEDFLGRHALTEGEVCHAA